MGDEHLSTIPEEESDEVIKFSVEDLIPISSESEDTSESDSDCDLLSCDDFSPINVYEEKSNIESKDSYEPALLVTPLSDANEDECFDPGGDIDEIDAFLDMDVSTDIENGYHDSKGDIIYLESLLIDNTIPNLPPEVFLDHDPKSLKDEPDNEDLKSMVKVESPFLLSSRSEDTIFDPDISAFHFSSLEPVAYKCPMEVCSSTCFVPNITMIWGEIAQILKTLVLVVLSIVHSIFNPSHAYIWESDILDLID
ncbi:hypothetical protein Tco_0327738 [Tanacetum coccineum]